MATKGKKKPVKVGVKRGRTPPPRPSTRRLEPETVRPPADDGLNPLIVGAALAEIYAPHARASEPEFSGHGGDFSGAGASASYDDRSIVSDSDSGSSDSSSSSDSGSSGGGDSGGGGGGD